MIIADTTLTDHHSIGVSGDAAVSGEVFPAHSAEVVGHDEDWFPGGKNLFLLQLDIFLFL